MMSTDNAPKSSPPTLPALTSTARALFVGLVWAAGMLLVFGLWLQAKGGTNAQTLGNVFFVGSVIAAAAAFLQFYTLLIKSENQETKAATFKQQQRIIGYLFLAGGLGLVIMACAVGIGKTPGGALRFVMANFAESMGSLLFGLLALGWGYALSQESSAGYSPLKFLAENRAPLKLASALLGIAALSTIVWLFFKFRDQTIPNWFGVWFGVWFTEVGALGAFSILCIGSLFFLNTADLGEAALRIFILIFGGAVGLILFCYSITKAIVWRQDTFLGGLVGWQGEDSWHFWLCAYVLIVSLVVMFLSFGLARTDIRTNPLLRRLMYGYDAVLQCLLLIGILIALNIVVYALMPFTFNWTKTRGVYDLSESTKNMLRGLKKETHIKVLIPQNSIVYKDLKNLLNNCKALSPNLIVDYISPDSEPVKYELLARNFKKILPEVRMGTIGRGVLLVHGKMPEGENHNVPYSFVPERKLWDEDRVGMHARDQNKLIFKGESEIFKELKFLLQDRSKRKVYVLQGNEEPGFDSRNPRIRTDFRLTFEQVDMGILVDRLKLDNYDIAGLTFAPEFLAKKDPNVVQAKEGKDKKKVVPDDCHTLIVAGSGRALSRETLDALENYVSRGGKMMVFLDVIAAQDYSSLRETGLEALLRRFGVEVGEEFALRRHDRERGPFDDATEMWARVPPKSENPLTRAFAGEIILLQRSSRIVSPAMPGGGRYSAEPILQIDPDERWLSIREKQFSNLRNPSAYMWKLQNDAERWSRAFKEESIPVAVAVSDTSDKARPRPVMVVFGDTDFITNVPMARSQSSREAYALFVSAMEWMAEREGIGALPRESANFSLKAEVVLSPGAIERMVYMPAWIMLISVISLGAGVWAVRRR